MVPLVARPLTPAIRRLARWLCPRAALLITAVSLPAAFPMHGTSAPTLLATALALVVLLLPLLALYLYARNVRVEVGDDDLAWTDMAGRRRSLKRQQIVEVVGHSIALPGLPTAAPVAVELRARGASVGLPEWLWSDEVLEDILSTLELPVRNTAHRFPTSLAKPKVAV